MDGRVRIGTQLDSSGVTKGIGDIKKLIAGAGIAKLIQESLSGFAEFESVLKKSETLYGDVEVSQSKLEKQMLSLSSATGETVEVLGEGLYTALSAGIPVTEDMGEAMAFMATNTKLAKAGFTDVETSVQATAKVLNAYKMETSEIDRVSNVLIATQNKGITTVGELSRYLAQVTPTASALGVSFEEVGASLATITAQGTPTAQATTQVRQVLAELGKTGTVASNNLVKVAQNAGLAETTFSEMIDSGMTLDEILKLMSDYADANNLSMIDMFSSIEAGQGALALSGANSEKFAENLEYMETSSGLVEEAYRKMSDTLTTQSERIKSSVKALSISIASSGGDLLTNLASSVADLFENLRKGFEEEGFKGLVTELINSIRTGFDDLLVNLDEKLPEFFNKGVQFIAQIYDGFVENLPTVAGSLAGKLATLIVNVFDSVKGNFKTTGQNLIVSMIEGFVDIQQALFTGLITMASNMVLIFKNTDFKAVGKDLIVSLINGLTEDAKQLAEKAWDIAKGVGNIFKNSWKIATTDLTFAEVWEESFDTALDEINQIDLAGKITTIDDLSKAVADAFAISVESATESSDFINKFVDAFTVSYKDFGGVQGDVQNGLNGTSKSLDLVKMSAEDAVNAVSDSKITKAKTIWEDLGDSISDSVADSLGYTVEEFQTFMDDIDNSESTFDKLGKLAGSVSDTIATGMFDSIDSIGDALADVTDGTSSWGDAFESVGDSILGATADIAKAIAKQLAGIAVAKALAGDWVGAGVAAAGAIALGYGGALLNKIQEWTGGEDKDAEPTYEETKQSEAQSIQQEIETTEKDRARAQQMANASTNPNDVRYYTEMYLALGDELEDLRRQLQFAQGFATGGIVGGTSYVGDKLLAFVNSRELILNQEQQGVLSDKINRLASRANNPVYLVVNVNGDTFGVDDFYNKVYNGIKGLQYEGALNQW